jgi:AraC-like ligand binding domain
MTKEKIPLYRLSHLAAPAPGPGEFMIESFGPYLERQSPHLHHAHRHIFYHMVCFREGAGSHSIDFLRYPVEAGQIYFMPPGQVHSWSFEGRPEGWVINFSVDFLRAFLLEPGYLDRFTFFGGRAEDSVVRLPSPVREEVYGMLDRMLRQFNGGERAARGGERTREGAADARSGSSVRGWLFAHEVAEFAPVFFCGAADLALAFAGVEAGGLVLESFDFFGGGDVDVIFNSLSVLQAMVEEFCDFDAPAFGLGLDFVFVADADVLGGFGADAVIFHLASVAGFGGFGPGLEETDGP